MIFNIPGHIDLIRSGEKTQTRRANRGIYQVGKDYAVQSKRGVKAESDMRIVIEKIWEEDGLGIAGGIPAVGNRENDVYLSEEDAWAEGGYTPKQFEEIFTALNPKRDWTRWVFEFHVIEVQK